jgi:predicted nucleic acid-binding protein
VILDDGLARRHAKLLELPFTGTIGVLLKAKQQALLPRIEPILDQLARLGFRLDPVTRKAALELAVE